MATGILKSWFSERGFGFIRPDEGGSDVFVHVTRLEESGVGPNVDAGDRLSYDIAADPKSGRMQAANLRLLSGSESRR